jgi:hypothetical protein
MVYIFVFFLACLPAQAQNTKPDSIYQYNGIDENPIFTYQYKNSKYRPDTKITINLREKTSQRYGETQSYTKNSVFLRASPYLCVNFLAHFKFHFGMI